MPRYILIDENSGYIWGDTGGLNGPARDETPEEAARRLDESLGEHGRTYEAHGANYRHNGQDAYHVYRADHKGADLVPLVEDGQDQETIRLVMTRCLKVSVVAVTSRRGDAA